jgi:hypothetical protein
MHVRTTLLVLVLALVASGCGDASRDHRDSRTTQASVLHSAPAAAAARPEGQSRKGQPRSSKPSTGVHATPRPTAHRPGAAVTRPMADIAPAPVPGSQPVDVRRAPIARSREANRPIPAGKHDRHGKLRPIVDPNNRPRVGQVKTPSTRTPQQSAAARASVERTAAAVRAAVPLAGTNPDPPKSPHELVRLPVATAVAAALRFYKAAADGRTARACGMLSNAARTRRALEALLDAKLVSKGCGAAISGGRSVSTPVLELRSATRGRAVVRALFAARSTQIVLERRGGGWRIVAATG